MITLGLDASSKTIGYAFVKDREILEIGFFDISKFKTHKEKAFSFINFINTKSWTKLVTKINVEASLNGFTRGKTTQQTLLMLARWNSVFCYILEEQFKTEVNAVDVNEMRIQLFGKCRVKGVESKTFVKQQIEKLFNVSKWIVKGKRKPVDDRMADAYDAIVAAFYKK